MTVDLTTGAAAPRTANIRAATGYRRDIDGMRGLAVLSVLLFHISPDFAPKGFLGVDIFFVISGFVITKLLVETRVDVLTFYTRRVNRLFPSLIVFFLITIAIIALFLPHEFLLQQSRDGFFASVFLSNFNLWIWIDYFYAGTSGSLFLHTWSLSVEEQFYILFPALFYFCRDNPEKLLLIVLGFLALSLTAYLLEDDPQTKFYFSHLRFWEILAGTAAYLTVSLRGSIDARSYVQALAILVMIAVMSPWDPISSDTAARLLVVSLSVLCVIVTGPENGLINNAGAVLVGKISYPLYLLHFPVILLLSKFSFGAGVIFGAMLGVAGFSYLMYRFVETPIRKHLNTKRTAAVLGSILLTIATLLFLQWSKNNIFENMNILEPRFEDKAVYQPFDKIVEDVTVACERAPDPSGHATPDDLPFGPMCRQSHPNEATHDVLVVGDSNAHHLVPGLIEALPDSRIRFFGAGLPTRNNTYYEAMFENHLEKNPGAIAILASNWYFRLVKFGPKPTFDETHLPFDFARRLTDLGYRVFVVSGAPTFDSTAEACMYDWWSTNQDGPCFMRRTTWDERRAPFLDALRRTGEAVPGIEFIDLTDFVCAGGVCSMLDGKRLIFRDYNHFTAHGSLLAAEFMLEQIRRTGPERSLP